MRCLEKANREAEKKKLQLAARFNVPLLEFNDSQRLKHEIESLKKGIVSLKKFETAIPEDRKQLLLTSFEESFAKIVKDEGNHLEQGFKEELLKLERSEDGKIIVNEKFMQFFLSITDFKNVVKKSSNKDFRNIHGKLVVDHFDTKEKLREFIYEWRQFFVETMDPQFLPHDWKAALKARAEEISQKISHNS